MVEVSEVMFADDVIHQKIILRKLMSMESTEQYEFALKWGVLIKSTTPKEILQDGKKRIIS